MTAERNREKRNNDYYFCYSWYQQDFLKEKGLFFITSAYSIGGNNDRFYLFEKTPELQEALKEYQEKSKKLGFEKGYHSKK